LVNDKGNSQKALGVKFNNNKTLMPCLLHKLVHSYIPSWLTDRVEG